MVWIVQYTARHFWLCLLKSFCNIYQHANNRSPADARTFGLLPSQLEQLGCHGKIYLLFRKRRSRSGVDRLDLALNNGHSRSLVDCTAARRTLEALFYAPQHAILSRRLTQSAKRALMPARQSSNCWLQETQVMSDRASRRACLTNHIREQQVILHRAIPRRACAFCPTVTLIPARWVGCRPAQLRETISRLRATRSQAPPR
jgi:hypothetical protein